MTQEESAMVAIVHPVDERIPAAKLLRLETIVQSPGFPGVGIRLPVMMGVTFASVGPMLSMAASPEIGLLGIYGAVIGAGIFGVVLPFHFGMPQFHPMPIITMCVGVGSQEAARHEAAATAAAAEHV
jgi:hypothetical protein